MSLSPSTLKPHHHDLQFPIAILELFSFLQTSIRTQIVCKGISAAAAGVALEFGVPKGQNCSGPMLKGAGSTKNCRLALKLHSTQPTLMNYIGASLPLGNKRHGSQCPPSKVGLKAIFPHWMQKCQQFTLVPKEEKSVPIIQ